MARLTRKNSFPRICYYFYARERDEKDAPIAGFFNFSMGQFLLLLLHSISWKRVYLTKRKEIRALIFFLTEVILVHAFRSSL